MPAIQDRRADARYPIRIAVLARRGGQALALETRDLSAGGACLAGRDVERLCVGDDLDVELPLPGRIPLKTRVEVRWSRGGKRGIQFGRAAQAIVGAFLATAVGLAPSTVSANAAVPTFDPQADQDLDTYDGSERPDETNVLSAFERSYEDIDECVAKAKRGRDIVLQGSADVQVLLNPHGQRPLGVNASVAGPQAKNRTLVECLRYASSQAPYPAYDGPPVVVEVSFDLDPGYDVVEE